MNCNFEESGFTVITNNSFDHSSSTSNPKQSLPGVCNVKPGALLFLMMDCIKEGSEYLIVPDPPSDSSSGLTIHPLLTSTNTVAAADKDVHEDTTSSSTAVDTPTKQIEYTYRSKAKVMTILGPDSVESSPLASKSGRDAPARSPQGLSRAPSSPSSVKALLLSPNRFNQLTRRFSLSPLSARLNRAALGSSKPNNETVDFDKKMSRPHTPDTIRKRRGFRPLSIVHSALFPFNFDLTEAMQAARVDNLASSPSMQTVRVQQDHQEREASSPAALDTDSDSTPSPSKAASIKTRVDESELENSDTTELVEPACDNMSTTSTIAEKKKPSPMINFEGERISVQEYLRRKKLAADAKVQGQAPPAEANTENVTIEDSYPRFYELPPPDPSRHPMFRADPFHCTSEAPPLMTNWTKHQIKQWAADKYLRDRGMLPNDTPSRLKKLLPKPSPEKEQTTIFQALEEGSPVLATGTRKTPQTPSRSITRNATPSDLHIEPGTYTPITDNFDKKPSSFRSFSNLFKTRSSTEKASSASTKSISSPIAFDHELINPTATPELKRYDLERYLRIVSNCPSTNFNWASMYPRHPNTGKEWKSRNLKCITCEPKACAVCKRSCCAYMAATIAKTDREDTATGKEALRRIADISKVFPYGKEVQTFLKCTTCEKIVCPDCCGMCPIDQCGDLECRRCKSPNPWAECEWHWESERCHKFNTIDGKPVSMPASSAIEVASTRARPADATGASSARYIGASSARTVNTSRASTSSATPEDDAASARTIRTRGKRTPAKEEEGGFF